MNRIRSIMVLFLIPLLSIANAANAQESQSSILSIAPKKCLLLSAWYQPEPSKSDSNRTEKILAEPEVKEFVADVRNMLNDAIPFVMKDESESNRFVAKVLMNEALDASFKRSGIIFVEDVNIGINSGLVKLSGGIVIEIGSNLDTVKNAIVSVIKSNEIEFEREKIAGHNFLSIPIPEAPIESNVLVGGVDGHLFVCFGRKATERAIERLGKAETPEWLKEVFKRSPVPRSSSVGFVDVKTITEKYLPLAGEEVVGIAESLGISCVSSIESVAGYDEVGIQSRMSMQFDGKPTGIFEMIDAGAINMQQVSKFPADSLFAASMAIDAKQILSIARKLMEEFEPRSLNELNNAMADIRDEFDIDVESEIIDLVGPTVSIFNGASDGWGMGAIMSVELRDAAKFKSTQRKLMGLLTDYARSEYAEFKITSKKFGNTEVTSLQVLEVPFPIEPSWCVLDDRVLFSLVPQTLRPFIQPNSNDQYLPVEKMLTANDSKNEKPLGFVFTDDQQQFELAYGYLPMMKSILPGMMNEMDRDGQSDELMEMISQITLPSARCIHRHLQPSYTIFQRTETGVEIDSHQIIPTPNSVAASGIAVALLLPAVQAAREAARRTQSANNIKQLSLAMHNFHDTRKRFPAAYSTDKDGKPLLSWRVHILPYIEQGALYDRFRLDEPWDSEHNIKLLKFMPRTYRSSNSMSREGTTVYRGIGGVNGTFAVPKNGEITGIGFGSIVDGSSNTIMFVEANDEIAIEWTKPGVIDAEKFEFWQMFGNNPGGTNCGFVDGSVTFISNTIDPKILKIMFMRNDGEAVPYDRGF